MRHRSARRLGTRGAGGSRRERDTAALSTDRGGRSVSYLTDGVHLYEELTWCENFGLTGGGWLTVRDCMTDAVRAMSELELALCEPVSDLPTRTTT